jgi:hypothetical protein
MGVFWRSGYERASLDVLLGATVARFFAVTIQGMRAMARLKSDRRALRQVARVALAALDAR